jgi:hypothetical protein
VVNQVTQSIFKGPRKDLFVEKDWYEFALFVTVVLETGHLSSFVSIISTPHMLLYYTHFRTFSTDSTIEIRRGGTDLR